MAFGSTAVAEFHLRGAPRSEQWVYYRCKCRDGIPNKSGTYVSTAFDALRLDGICLAEHWPYNPVRRGSEGQGPPPPVAVREAAKIRSAQTIVLGARSREQAEALLSGRLRPGLAPSPFTLGIPIFKSGRSNPWTHRTGHFPDPLPGESRVGGHAMTVAFCDGEKVGGRNSWGAGWASECPLGAGHFTISWSYYTRFNHAAYACTYSGQSWAFVPGPLVAGFLTLALAGSGVWAVLDTHDEQGLDRSDSAVVTTVEPWRCRVRRGETLTSISLRIGVPVQKLQVLNSVVGPELQAGELLLVDPGAGLPSETEWVVRSGQTLWGIGQACGSSVPGIMRRNGLRSSRIRPGMILRVPVVSAVDGTGEWS